MSNVEDDYSDYIQTTSTIAEGYIWLTGFAFTTLTLLVTLLPDLSQLFSQVTLFFVTFACDLLLFVSAWGAFNLVFLCRKVPPLTRQLRIWNYLSLSGFTLFGAIPVLMFLVMKLTYLALVSGLVWIAFMIALYRVGWKPLTTYRATRARMLARPRQKEKAT